MPSHARPTRAAWLALAVLGALPATGSAQDRHLRVEVTVPGTPDTLWPLWSTDDGVRSFFAPGSHIEARPDGWYEIFFLPNMPTGMRGADSMRVLAAEPGRRIMFTWNSPVTFGNARSQRTIVEVAFMPVGADSTKVMLTHFGFGREEVWDRIYEYFDGSWNAVVMPRFRHRVLHGPIDWAKLPALPPIHATAKQQLAPMAAR